MLGCRRDFFFVKINGVPHLVRKLLPEASGKQVQNVEDIVNKIKHTTSTTTLSIMCKCIQYFVVNFRIGDGKVT